MSYTRRTGMFAFTMWAMLAVSAAFLHGNESAKTGLWYGVDFGAKASAVATPFAEEFDCTESLQRALDAAGGAGGGTVVLPAGRFAVHGVLSIPRGVTLEGTYRAAVTIESKDQPADGTILLAYAGRGTTEGPAFLTLAGNNAVVKGLAVIYPEWNRADLPPIPYPPCIVSHDTVNVGVIDCCLLNPYEGIKFVRAARHLVRNVTGYPVWRGIFVDECYDIGHIENIHFWPFGLIYDPKDPFCEWVNIHSVAFELARTDWHYVANTFCFGYGVGYKFSDCGSGGTNGNFLGLGADSCRRAVLVEQAQAPGLLITNGEFVGRWRGEDSVCIEIGEECAGKVSLVNCSFWGPIDTCVEMKSTRCPFTAETCHFVHWDNMGLGKPAIDLLAGKANVSNCTFEQAGTNVRVGDAVRSVILSGNQADGGFRVEGISDANRARVITFGNELDPVFLEPGATEHYRLTIGGNGDGRFLKRWFGRERRTIDGKRLPFRWSSGICELELPVTPGRSYTATLWLDVPEKALQGTEAYGIYRGEERLAELSPGYQSVTVPLAASETDSLSLSIRVCAWESSGADTRRLGVQGFSVEMKAEGASPRYFDLAKEKWAE